MTPANDSDRKRAEDLWEILSTQDEKAVVQIAEVIKAERSRVLALPEVEEIKNAIMWNHPEGSPAESDRLKALRAFSRLRSGAEK